MKVDKGMLLIALLIMSVYIYNSKMQGLDAGANAQIEADYAKFTNVPGGYSIYYPTDIVLYWRDGYFGEQKPFPSLVYYGPGQRSTLEPHDGFHIDFLETTTTNKSITEFVSKKMREMVKVPEGNAQVDIDFSSKWYGVNKMHKAEYNNGYRDTVDYFIVCPKSANQMNNFRVIHLRSSPYSSGPINKTYQDKIDEVLNNFQCE